MKIALMDGGSVNMGDLSWEGLSKYGEVVEYEEIIPHSDPTPMIGDCDVVIGSKLMITGEVMDACPNLKFISVIATGYNTVDINYCRTKGIQVSNVPSYGTEAISQNAVALLLELTNRVAHHDAEVRKGRKNTDKDWCFWDYSVMELEGKTAGIIGLGRIGKITARILEAFGMNVLAFDKFHCPEWESENRHYVDIETLYAQSDVIFLHCPLFDDNYHMINKDSIAKMKDGALLINNSRGALVVDQDLADALNSGKLAGAGLDAIEVEPIEAGNPLLSAKNCYITPHISWAALDCRKRLQSTAIDNVRAFLSNNPINLV